ncbi:MAG: hypothetical protein GXP31_13305 [Kiritimatiellaeota bacterium]|nr:hypothetical protein [Kiritimatiellota bacterium]
MDISTSLKVLDLLCDALTTPGTEAEALGRITVITRELLGTRQMVILLREEDRAELIVKTCAGIEAPGVRPGSPLAVPPRVKGILWKLRFVHRIGPLPVGLEGIEFPIAAAPLRVKGERIGVLIAGGLQRPETGFSAVQRRLFGLVAALASLILENAKAYDYLRQQFAQRSREVMDANRRDGNGTDDASRLVVTSLKDPGKVARLLAVSFYNELSRAGFSANHIVTAAAELLACISRQAPLDDKPQEGLAAAE